MNPSFGLGYSSSDADVNGDNQIGLAEALYVLQRIARLRNNRFPVLAPIGDKTVTEGSLLSFTLSATDEDGDALMYDVSGLPDGALFNATTGVFSWTPSPGQQGDYPMTFTASDGLGGTDNETITVNVTPFTLLTPDYPLNIGDWMDYRQSSTGTIRRTTVTGPTSIGGVSTIGINSSSGTEYYTSDLSGVKLYGVYINDPEYSGNITWDTPLLLFPNNAQLYQTQVSYSSFTWNLYVPEYGKYVLAHGDITATTNILGLEDVQTENTTLKDCVKISIVFDFLIKNVEVDGRIVEVNEYIYGDPVVYWLYKGVGCVKQSFVGETYLITQSYINGVPRTY